jgi:succinate dehydrogenase flavin-adding protein (antitoxin of CptAB toxin-antitoxin module)
MQEEIKKLIKVYEIQKREYDLMLDKFNEKGIEDLDFEETETYGVFLGKSELYENVIDDLKQLIS